jgi:hypothetical protein
MISDRCNLAANESQALVPPKLFSQKILYHLEQGLTSFEPLVNPKRFAVLVATTTPPRPDSCTDTHLYNPNHHHCGVMGRDVSLQGGWY